MDKIEKYPGFYRFHLIIENTGQRGTLQLILTHNEIIIFDLANY